MGMVGGANQGLQSPRDKVGRPRGLGHEHILKFNPFFLGF